MFNLIRNVMFVLLLIFSICNASEKTTKSEKPKLESLTLSTEQTIITKKTDENQIKEPIKVMATYSDGHSEEVTDLVTWHKTSKRIKFYYDHFRALEGNFTVSALLDDVVSNEITLKIVNETQKLLTSTVINNDKMFYPNRDAVIMFRLNKKPTADVKLKLRLNESEGVKFLTSSPYGSLETELLFKVDKWDDLITRRSDVHIIDMDRNNTNDYTIITETFVSKDPYYSGKKPLDIVVHKDTDIKLIEPPLQQRRGAIRGIPIKFRVTSKHKRLNYELVNPPKGMKILGRSDLGEWREMTEDGVDVQWDVPMDIEEKIYTITMKATDKEGNKGQINFNIKVPKTTIISTKIENNELTVIDKNSNLYGMKMKGHNGEDISNMQLRYVEYEDVWKKHIKKKNPEDITERTVYVIDNMPGALDVKFPEYADSIKEARKLGAGLYRYDGTFIGYSYWVEAVYNEYIYDGTSGTTIQYNLPIGLQYTGSKVFLDVIEKAQYKDK